MLELSYRIVGSCSSYRIVGSRASYIGIVRIVESAKLIYWQSELVYNVKGRVASMNAVAMSFIKYKQAKEQENYHIVVCHAGNIAMLAFVCQVPAPGASHPIRHVMLWQ